jgi:hypothetical protein
MEKPVKVKAVVHFNRSLSAALVARFFTAVISGTGLMQDWLVAAIYEFGDVAGFLVQAENPARSLK